MLLPRDNDVVPLSEIIPRPNSIYFLETSAASTINPRVACSIESAAKHHPNNSIVSCYFHNLYHYVITILKTCINYCYNKKYSSI